MQPATESQTESVFFMEPNEAIEWNAAQPEPQNLPLYAQSGQAQSAFSQNTTTFD